MVFANGDTYGTAVCFNMRCIGECAAVVVETRIWPLCKALGGVGKNSVLLLLLHILILNASFAVVASLSHENQKMSVFDSSSPSAAAGIY
jgi:hypothetical protein